MQTETQQTFESILNLCISVEKSKGVIQSNIVEILSTDENQADFLDYINDYLIRDDVSKKKIHAFQNNLNLKSTQERHYDIGEEESLTEVVKLKRDPKSTLSQAERPYIFIIEAIKEPKVKTLEEEIDAFKKAMAKKFNADLNISQK